MKSNSIFIDTSKVKSGGIYNINIRIKMKDKSIVRGVVYSSNCDFCIGAAVEVKEKNRYTEEITILGYCFTDNKGEYTFVVEPKLDCLYEISVYSQEV